MLKQIVLISTFIFCTVILLMYVFQRHLIYFPDVHKPKPDKYDAKDMTVITLHTEDKIQLTAWYKPAADHKSTLLYLHGNAGHIGYRMPLVRQFIKAGLGVLLLEYRGYGGNAGKPTEKGLYKDARAAVNFLEQQGIKSSQLVMYGESLGSAVATKMAIEHPVCAVILLSPLTSLPSLARYHYPWILVKPWDRFDSLDRISKINAPLLIVHGKRDQVVPYQEGLILFNQAVEPKKMITFEQLDHHNMWSGNGFTASLIQFIEAHCSD